MLHRLCALQMRIALMLIFYDKEAPKKSANLSVNSDLLKQARNLKINLSATLEHALAQQVKKAAKENWLKDNKQALQTLNELAEENGLFSDPYKKF